MPINRRNQFNGDPSQLCHILRYCATQILVHVLLWDICSSFHSNQTNRVFTCDMSNLNLFNLFNEMAWHGVIVCLFFPCVQNLRHYFSRFLSNVRYMTGLLNFLCRCVETDGYPLVICTCVAYIAVAFDLLLNWLQNALRFIKVKMQFPFCLIASNWLNLLAGKEIIKHLCFTCWWQIPSFILGAYRFCDPKHMEISYSSLKRKCNLRTGFNDNIKQ